MHDSVLFLLLLLVESLSPYESQQGIVGGLPGSRLSSEHIVMKRVEEQKKIGQRQYSPSEVTAVDQLDRALRGSNAEV